MVQRMKEVRSPRHEAVRQFLRMKRLEAELSQGGLAERMGRKQQWISDVESGEHRVTVVEFCEFAEALHFDIRSAIRRIYETKAK
jgi:transcriptional regulator with XRE-family HTH domain